VQLRTKLYLCGTTTSGDGVSPRCAQLGLNAIDCLESGNMRDAAAGGGNNASAGSHSQGAAASADASGGAPGGAAGGVAGTATADTSAALSSTGRTPASAGDGGMHHVLRQCRASRVHCALSSATAVPLTESCTVRDAGMHGSASADAEPWNRPYSSTWLTDAAAAARRYACATGLVQSYAEEFGQTIANGGYAPLIDCNGLGVVPGDPSGPGLVDWRVSGGEQSSGGATSSGESETARRLPYEANLIGHEEDAWAMALCAKCMGRPETMIKACRRPATLATCQREEGAYPRLVAQCLHSPTLQFMHTLLTVTCALFWLAAGAYDESVCNLCMDDVVGNVLPSTGKGCSLFRGTPPDRAHLTSASRTGRPPSHPLPAPSPVLITHVPASHLGSSTPISTRTSHMPIRYHMPLH
jgi:hypothetical protein